MLLHFSWQMYPKPGVACANRPDTCATDQFDFGTWAYSYGYTVSAGLAQHAMNVIKGESKLDNIEDIAKAYGVFSPKAEWNGSNYTNATTGVKSPNTFLVYQDTYIMGNPGRFMLTPEVEVPEKYFTIK